MPKVEFNAAQIGHDSKLIIDGVDVTNDVRRVTIDAEVGNFTKLEVEYVCVEGVINGEVEVFHVCPYPPPDEDFPFPQEINGGSTS